MADLPPEPADPAPVTPDPVTVTAGDIAAFTARLARQRSPALGGDPADRAELLSDKADLFARIARQHTRTDPALADQARDIAGHAHSAADSPTTHPSRRTPAHREPRQNHDQPLHAEVDHGSTSAKGRPPGRVWLVRLRRDNRAVIIATGLTRPAAEHLADQINQLQHPPDNQVRHTENTDTDDTTNVNDLASPSSPRQGISLSNTAEFRRAPSVLRRQHSVGVREVARLISRLRHRHFGVFVTTRLARRNPWGGARWRTRHVADRRVRQQLRQPGYAPSGFRSESGQLFAIAEYVRTAAASTADRAYVLISQTC